MRRAIIIVIVVLAAAAAVWRAAGRQDGPAVQYRQVEVQKGDLTSVVSSTGTLEPVVTVQVGTQVSGILSDLPVDFNDPVRAGQVIARIDTTLLASAVAGSRAQLDRAAAELRQAEREFARLQALYKENLVAETEFNAAQYALDVAKASVESAQVDLQRARRNLGYATITSPIDGTVISRAVDVGQTVQASFSAPELFQIAGDLTKMQILVSVDESDIGQIRVGQTARFTVQAFPDDTFTGTVTQVRLQSVIAENVVNYPAVVSVDNADLRLRPGMTATVDFVVKEAKDVFYVPNAALRYRPEQQAMTEVLARKRSEREASGGGGGGGADRPQAAAGGPPHGAGGNGMVGGTLPADRGMLWTADASGQLDVMFVRTGISDGTNTQVGGPSIEAGLKVIAGVASSAAAATSSSPFQQQAPASGPPRPGGF